MYIYTWMSEAQLRRFIRHFLIEASSPTEELAGFYEDASDWGMKAITLYYPSRIERDLNNVSQGVVGYIAAQKPKQRCAGAWEIKMAGGRGYGGILYPAMFAAVGGPLVPDRNSLTDDAVRGWGKQGSRKKTALDNFYVDDVQKATPEDDSDDCRVRTWNRDKETGQWVGDPVLDNAYFPKGNENSIFQKLLSNHDNFIESLKDKDADVDSLLAQISKAGVERFERERLG
jgi:hypothetical protein